MCMCCQAAIWVPHIMYSHVLKDHFLEKQLQMRRGRGHEDMNVRGGRGEEGLERGMRVGRRGIGGQETRRSIGQGVGNEEEGWNMWGLGEVLYIIKG